MRRERGALLGVVLVLLVVLMAASVFAFWSLRSDAGAVANDRLSRQLFDCAEQGLAMAKQRFTTVDRGKWDEFLNTDVCNLAVPAFPCPPFPAGATGVAPPKYPNGDPYKTTITVGTGAAAINLEYMVGIYNNSENVVPAPKCLQPDPTCTFHDGDNTIVVWSRCREPISGLSRATSAVITSPVPTNGCPYRGMAGNGCRGAGNQN
jgi:hypothetical protein